MSKKKQARDFHVSLPFPENKVKAVIGPSGKSILIRCLNRMHELVPGTKVHGKVMLDGVDTYSSTMGGSSWNSATRRTPSSIQRRT